MTFRPTAFERSTIARLGLHNRQTPRRLVNERVIALAHCPRSATLGTSRASPVMPERSRRM